MFKSDFHLACSPFDEQTFDPLFQFFGFRWAGKFLATHVVNLVVAGVQGEEITELRHNVDVDIPIRQVSKIWEGIWLFQQSTAFFLRQL